MLYLILIDFANKQLKKTMMKKLLLIAGFSIGLVSVNAQIMQGNVMIDPYIGVPNWANSLLYKLFQREEEKPEVLNMNRLFSQPL